MFRPVTRHYHEDYSNGIVRVSGDFTVVPYRCSQWDILQLLVILSDSTVLYCIVLAVLYFTV